MALLARIPRSHSIRQFRRAARCRFAEANRAAEAGDRLIGVYLAGYAAEMTLKATYFRIAGRQPTDPISLADLQAAKAHAKTTLGMIWPGNLHDLVRWGELIVAERNRLGPPCPVALASRLSNRLVRISSNWREDLRYHGNRPRLGELSETFEAVKWLFANEPRLVR